MRPILGPCWGADQDILIRTYRLIIRPKIDYGCVVYGSSNAQQLKSIDVIANEAMRISTRSFKTTPIDTLHILTNEPPLQYRRELLLRTFFKSKCCLNNPAYSCIVNRRLEEFFTSRRLHSPVVLRIVEVLARRSIPTQPVMLFSTPTSYTWEVHSPSVDLTHTELPKI